MTDWDIKRIIWGGSSPLPWLQANGATATNPTDAWKQFLDARGFWDGTMTGSKIAWMQAQSGLTSRNVNTLEAEMIKLGTYSGATVIDILDPSDIAASDKSGTKVINWTSRILGHTYTQGTDSRRPTQAELGGIVVFDKSATQFLLYSTHVSEFDFGTDDFAIRVAFNFNVDDNAVHGLFGQGAGNNAGAIMQLNTSGTNDFGTFLTSNGSATDVANSDDPAITSAFKVFCGYRDGGTSKSRLDGVQQSDGDANNRNITGGTFGSVIGSRADGTKGYTVFPLDGEIASIVVFGGDSFPTLNEEKGADAALRRRFVA